MSSIDCALLGFLINQPLSAYDLAKYIQKYELGDLVKLSTPAVYKNLKNLVKKKFLDVRGIKQGENPEKRIYTVNAQGREYFYTLLESYTGDKIKYQFDFNSIIVNLDKLPKPRRQKYLAQLKTQIMKSREETFLHLQEWRNQSPMADILISQVTLVNDALMVWITAMEKQVVGLK
ncbi:MAG: PadR family transcriptional regulator [Spirochaetales bacterium]|nr:PadR family transcriptional regulator [Spirochaetales bacterium]